METDTAVGSSEPGEMKRSSFTGKVGFILAAAGSAVGLGNLWRFPYLADKYGGGTFLFVYIILVIVFGLALMVTEISLGRRTGKSCIDAFRDLSEKYSFIGWLAALVPIIIVPYYCVIGGWVTKYFFEFATGNAAATADGGGFFGSFMSCGFDGVLNSPMFWFLIFLAFCILVVALGVEKGIERSSKVLMPILFVLMIVIVAYVLTMPGQGGVTAADGVVKYLKPDFSNFRMETVLGATSQLFYSMSLAMGIMITYGSYMKKDVSIPKSALQIAGIDTGVAFLAGLMIIPASMMFGIGGGASGPGLMFVSMPMIFDQMPAGQVIGAAFFFLVIIAALTSAISLAETVVSMIQDRLKWVRGKATFATLIIIIGLGALSAYGYGPLEGIHLMINGAEYCFLDIFDMVSNSILMPVVAILICMFVGYVVKPKLVIDEIQADGREFKYATIYTYLVKIVCPVLLAVVLVSGLLGMFGVISI